VVEAGFEPKGIFGDIRNHSVNIGYYACRSERRVEDNAMGMQRRIERTRRIVREKGGQNVRSQPISVPAFANAGSGKGFKLTQSHPQGTVIRLHHFLIPCHQSCD